MNYHEGKFLKVSHCYLNINLFKRLILYFTQWKNIQCLLLIFLLGNTYLNRIDM